MTGEDLQQIEQLLDRFSAEIRGELRGEVRDQSQRFDDKLTVLETRFDAKLDTKLTEMETRFDGKLAEQSEDFERWFGIQREAFHHDLALVAEGHQMLGEKLDRVADEFRARTEAIERDILTHKADPQAHQGWRVSEDEAT